MRVRHIDNSRQSGSTIFSTSHYQRHGFRKNKKLLKKVFISSTSVVWNSYDSKKYLARYDKYICMGSHVNYPLFLSDFNETWIFWTNFRKVLKYQISCNPSIGSRVVPYGRTDMTKLIIAVRNFSNASKIFQTKVVEKIETHFMSSNVFFLPKSMPFMT
jgi:hypothetical protein